MDALLKPSRVERVLVPGRMIDAKYRVERVLGRGGTGIVVLATHVLIQQEVAIKVLTREFETEPIARERFLREARAATMIRSEHVVRVFDYGSSDGLPYIVMELLEGVNVAKLLERGPLSVNEAIDCILQVCVALAEVHVAGIIHRDVKPENLFVTRGPRGEALVKIIDFGISKILPSGRRGHAAIITSEDLLGSPVYMSPEQIRAPREVDQRTDIWSVGAVFYELLTAASPFMAPTLSELFRAIEVSPPEPLGSYRSGIPALVQQAIGRCLEKSPDKRFADIGELAEALRPEAPPRARAYVDSTLEVLRRARVPRATPVASWAAPSFAESNGRKTTRRWPRRVVWASAAIVGVLAVGAPLLAANGRRLPARSSSAHGLERETKVELVRLRKSGISPPSIQEPREALRTSPPAATRHAPPPIVGASHADPRALTATDYESRALPDFGDRK
jgi:eukaryotic-like serine/threonine-protein kinase